MSKIKVLVVDDSSVYRKILSNILQKDPQIEVVGSAANGKIALDLISKLKPDVITLDLEMPEMDGLETLDHIKKQNLPVGVIVFSSHSHAGARLTFEALEKGAFDFLPKPSNNSFTQNIEKIANSLIPKIKLCYAKKLLSTQRAHPIRPLRPTPAPKSRISLVTKRDAVAIGSSTGGPSALKEVLSQLDPKIYVPIFIVQHMPPVFSTQLAERLNKICPLTVKEAENGEVVKPKVVYIAPGDYHMEVNKKGEHVIIKLHKGPPENNCRPSVDVFFRSAAQVYKDKILAIVLTGMGSDGLKGAKMLKEKGAYIVAQDEESSVVWGMPGAVAKAGIADEIVPLSKVAHLISEVSKKTV